MSKAKDSHNNIENVSDKIKRKNRSEKDVTKKDRKIKFTNEKKKYDALYTGDTSKLLIVDQEQTIAGSELESITKPPNTKTNVNVAFDPEKVRNIKTESIEVYDERETNDKWQSLSANSQLDTLTKSELQNFALIDSNVTKSVKGEFVEDETDIEHFYPDSSMYKVSSNMYKITASSDDDEIDLNRETPFSFQHKLNGPVKKKMAPKPHHPYKKVPDKKKASNLTWDYDHTMEPYNDSIMDIKHEHISIENDKLQNVLQDIDKKMNFLDSYITDLRNISLNINEYMDRVEKKIPGLVESCDTLETDRIIKNIQLYHDELHQISSNIIKSNSSFQQEVLQMQNDTRDFIQNSSVVQHHLNTALTEVLEKIEVSFIPKELVIRLQNGLSDLLGQKLSKNELTVYAKKLAQNVVTDVYQNFEKNSNLHTDVISLNEKGSINETVEGTISKIIHNQIEDSYEHVTKLFENFIQDFMQKQTSEKLSNFNSTLDEARDKLIQQLSDFIQKAVNKPLTQSQIKFNEVSSLIVSLKNIIADIGSSTVNDNLVRLNGNFKRLEDVIVQLKGKIEEHSRQQRSSSRKTISKKSGKPINRFSTFKSSKKKRGGTDLETLMASLRISPDNCKLKQNLESDMSSVKLEANNQFELQIAKLKLEYDKLRSDIAFKDNQHDIAHAELMQKIGSHKLVFTFSREEGTGLVDSALYCNLDDRKRFLIFWNEKMGKIHNVSTAIHDHLVALKDHKGIAKKVLENFSTYFKYLSKLERVIGSRIRICSEMHNTSMLIYQTGPPFDYSFYPISKRCIDENLSVSSNVNYATCPRLALIHPQLNEPNFMVGDLLEFIETSDIFPVNCVYSIVRRNEIIDQYNERYVLNDEKNELLGVLILHKDSPDNNIRKFKIGDTGNDELLTKHILYSWFESDTESKKPSHLLPGTELNSYFLGNIFSADVIHSKITIIQHIVVNFIFKTLNAEMHVRNQERDLFPLIQVIDMVYQCTRIILVQTSDEQYIQSALNLFAKTILESGFLKLHPEMKSVLSYLYQMNNKSVQNYALLDEIIKLLVHAT